MLNPIQITRRLVTIDPLMQPTRSVLALLHAVEFVESQIREKNVAISASLVKKIGAVKAITVAEIIERPTITMESIREVLVAIRAESPRTEELSNVRIPESVGSMRYVTSVEALANSLLSLIRGFDLLPIAE